MATTVDQKLLRQTKFPAEFSQKVDMKKVNVEVMKKWIAEKISDILGNEDDVVIELCFNLLEGARFPDIKVLQIQLTGFLEKDTPAFCKELWTLCLSAQANPQGVPKELLEAKKLELIQEKILSERAVEEAQRRREQERARERDLDNVRQRERGERGRGRFRGGRNGRDYDRRPQRDSRSPPRRRDSNEYRVAAPGREVDTYIPHESRRRHDKPRHRSPVSRISRSRSRSLRRSATPPRRTRRRSISRSLSRSRSPPSRRKRRHLSRSRSISLTPQRRTYRDSPSPARRRSSRRSRERKRKSDGAIGRGYERSRHTSSEKSRSRSPRRFHNGKNSRSVSSSRSPHRTSQHKRRRRSPSLSRSPSSQRRSLSPRRHEKSGRSSRNKRSPSNDNDNHADVRKERTRERHRQHSRRAPSNSGSKSPPAKKRRQSIERYVPNSRRERNTSSPDDYDANQFKDKDGNVVKAGHEMGSDE